MSDSSKKEPGADAAAVANSPEEAALAEADARPAEDLQGFETAEPTKPAPLPLLEQIRDAPKSGAEFRELMTNSDPDAELDAAASDLEALIRSGSGESPGLPSQPLPPAVNKRARMKISGDFAAAKEKSGARSPRSVLRPSTGKHEADTARHQAPHKKREVDEVEPLGGFLGARNRATPTSGTPALATEVWSFTSPEDVLETFHAHHVVINDEVATTIHLADNLNRPLLLEGPPGAGQVEVARIWAAAGNKRLIRIRCRPGHTLAGEYHQWERTRSGLYINLFGQEATGTNVTEWMEKHEDAGDPARTSVLLQTVLDAFRMPEEVFLLIDDIDLITPGVEHVLDELLDELIVEQERNDRRLPTLVLTSQRRRELNSHLRSVAIPLFLPLPTEAQIVEMLVLRVPGVNPLLARQVAKFAVEIRSPYYHNPPSIAEFAEWMQALVLLKVDQLSAPAANRTLNILLRHPDDIAEVKAMIEKGRVRFETVEDVEKAAVEESLDDAWNRVGLGNLQSDDSNKIEPDTWWSETVLENEEVAISFESYKGEKHPSGSMTAVSRSRPGIPSLKTLGITTAAKGSAKVKPPSRKGIPALDKNVALARGLFPATQKMPSDVNAKLAAISMRFKEQIAADRAANAAAPPPLVIPPPLPSPHAEPRTDVTAAVSRHAGITSGAPPIPRGIPSPAASGDLPLFGKSPVDTGEAPVVQPPSAVLELDDLGALEDDEDYGPTLTIEASKLEQAAMTVPPELPNSGAPPIPDYRGLSSSREPIPHPDSETSAAFDQALASANTGLAAPVLKSEASAVVPGNLPAKQLVTGQFTVADVMRQAETPPSPMRPVTPTRSSNSMILGLLAGIVVLVVLAIVAIVVLGGDDDDEADSDEVASDDDDSGEDGDDGDGDAGDGDGGDDGDGSGGDDGDGTGGGGVASGNGTGGTGGGVNDDDTGDENPNAGADATNNGGDSANGGDTTDPGNDTPKPSRAAKSLEEALQLTEGSWAERDGEAAAGFLQPACQRGEQVACTRLAWMHQRGLFVSFDTEKALGILDTACEAGHQPACREWGRARIQSDLGRDDLIEASNVLEKACATGDADACAWHAYALDRGRGVDKDRETAVALYQEACTKGSGMACGTMGIKYILGAGIGRDRSKAAEMLQKGCDLGWGEACHELAKAYRRGKGVDKSTKRSEELHTQACNNNHGPACTRECYQRGESQMCEWGCLLDDERGCYRTAYKIDKANDARKKAGKHLEYYTRACDLGSKRACKIVRSRLD